MIIKVSFGKANDLAEICHFIKIAYGLCRDWPDDILYPWTKWYIDSGLCVIGREEVISQNISISGHVKSLLLGRPTDKAEICKTQQYYYNFEGDTFFCDALITKHSKSIPVMANVMIKGLGQKEYLAFTRDRDKMKKVKIYKTQEFLSYYE